MTRRSSSRRTWTVILWFALLSFSLEPVVCPLMWLLCDLDRLDGRLTTEVTKSRSLEKELGEVKATLLKESEEHDALRVTIQLVRNDLELAPVQEMSSLVVRSV